MKRHFFIGLTIAATTGIGASANGPMPMKRLHQDVVTPTAKGIPGSDGIIRKVPRSIRKTRSAEPGKGYVLYENFSSWDGNTKGWLPEGWKLEHKGECSISNTWNPYQPGAYEPAVADGDYCYQVFYADENQDEWLISPAITPEEDMLLAFHMLLDPIWHYETSNLNWITMEYEGEKKVIYTLQILIREEGGEWQLLRDYAEEYKGYSGRELQAISGPTTLSKQTIGLEEYIGKKVQIAFRYYGKGGNNMMLDAIAVGYPTLDDVWYMNPSNALYWGFSRDSYFSEMPEDIAFYPVGSPISWLNMSGEEAEYSWSYPRQENDGFSTVAEDEYELSLSFSPERPGDTPSLYESPTLKAEARHRIDAAYLSPVRYFQTGGQPTFINSDGRQEHTLFQFPMERQGISFTGVMDDAQGALSVPVFGYNEFSDVYWLNYSLNGAEPMEGNFSHLVGIGNVYFPSYDAPLVVNGMSVYGWGLIGEDAELTATVYAFDSEMHTDPSTYTVVGRASISGKEIQYLENLGMKDYMHMPFTFDEPVIVQASEEHPAFLFMLEGFRSEKVEYFAPLHSKLPIEDSFAPGYILNEINLNGHVERDTYFSLKSMRYVEDGEYKDDINGAFAIGLNAEYPWLSTETTEIELGADGTASISLDSYYDASQLKIEAPRGIKATISGRYDECLLSLSKDAGAEDGDIKISGPGVELNLAVKAGASVASLIADKEVEAIFDLSGRKVTSCDAAGIYTVKYSDGKVRKLIVK